MAKKRSKPPAKKSPASQQTKTTGKHPGRKDSKGRLLCAAANKAGGGCGQPALPGKLVCRYHGGMTPRGPAHPAWKTGEWSNYLPTRYREQAEEILSDPELTSVRKMIVECDLRRTELFGQLESGEAGAIWDELIATKARVDQARADGKRAEVTEAMNRLWAVIDRGANDIQVWKEIYDNQEHRRRLSDTESRRLERMQAYLTAEQVTALAYRIADLVGEVFRESKDQLAIFFDRLTSLEGWERRPRRGETRPDLKH
jgi:hypothetical protein